MILPQNPIISCHLFSKLGYFWSITALNAWVSQMVLVCMVPQWIFIVSWKLLKHDIARFWRISSSDTEDGFRLQLTAVKDAPSASWCSFGFGIIRVYKTSNKSHFPAETDLDLFMYSTKVQKIDFFKNWNVSELSNTLGD